MATEKKFSNNTANSSLSERGSSVPNDLPDSKKDEKQLRSEETFIELPDVKDIPGQEFVHVAPLGELADTTIASDDEEGVGVFDLDDSEDFTTGTEADVQLDEKRALQDSTYMPTRDEDNLRQAKMDSTDLDGEPLNEGSFGSLQTARDLDIPGSRDETFSDSSGQGDEENEGYSIDDTDTNEPGENRSGL